MASHIIRPDARSRNNHVLGAFANLYGMGGKYSTLYRSGNRGEYRQTRV